MIQFYSPDIVINPVLPESDSQHCVRVLRMRQGDVLEVIDGKGHRYSCRLEDPHPKRAIVSILSVEDMPLPWSQQITIAVAPTKHMDRMEWLVEKLVEIGVDRIIPIRCQHSERKEVKVERLEKIAISAMKQSLKAVLPEIWEMTPVTHVIANMEAQQRYIAYCDDVVERISLARSYQPHKSMIVLIGPEGDFSPTEVHAALNAGYRAVTLGEVRLRTETAALYACATAHVIDQLNPQ